jgi:hypothetical protein
VKPKISEADFAVLVAQTGLTLTATQRQDIYDVYGLVEAMRERVHAPLPREAEPSLIFQPQGAA